MGCVRRPCLPSQKSDFSESSATPHSLKNSGVTLLVVASSATAFAPFSQNSACERSPSGSGQAQPGQSKPSFWLTFRSVRVPRTRPISRAACFIEDHTAASPPEVSDAPSNSPPVNSSGGCARTRETVAPASSRRAGASTRAGSSTSMRECQCVACAAEDSSAASARAACVSRPVSFSAHISVRSRTREILLQAREINVAPVLSSLLTRILLTYGYSSSAGQNLHQE